VILPVEPEDDASDAPERLVALPSDPEPAHPALVAAGADKRKRQLQRDLRDSEMARGRLLGELGHMKRLLYHLVATYCDGQVMVSAESLEANDGRFQVTEAPGGVMFRVVKPEPAPQAAPE